MRFNVGIAFFVIMSFIRTHFTAVGKNIPRYGSGYGITVVPYHSWIQPLDPVVGITVGWIQWLDPAVVWYHNDTIVVPT